MCILHDAFLSVCAFMIAFKRHFQTSCANELNNLISQTYRDDSRPRRARRRTKSETRSSNNTIAVASACHSAHGEQPINKATVDWIVCQINKNLPKRCKFTKKPTAQMWRPGKLLASERSRFCWEKSVEVRTVRKQFFCLKTSHTAQYSPKYTWREGCGLLFRFSSLVGEGGK